MSEDGPSFKEPPQPQRGKNRFINGLLNVVRDLNAKRQEVNTNPSLTTKQKDVIARNITGRINSKQDLLNRTRAAYNYAYEIKAKKEDPPNNNGTNKTEKSENGQKSK